MDPLLAVILLALAATALTVLLGLFAMGSGGSTDDIVSTPLMWARIGLQSFTLLLLILAVFIETG
ncbi:MAG: HIG1 domain-containing protein [Gammaproteobacteria bacterium]